MEVGGQGDTDDSTPHLPAPIPRGSGKGRLWGCGGDAGWRCVQSIAKGSWAIPSPGGTYPCSLSQGLESNGHQFHKNTNNTNNTH